MKLNVDKVLERLSRLQTAMGIDQPVALPDIDWGVLGGKGIDVDPGEVSVDDEGIIRFHGQAVVTYIRDQSSSPSGHWSTFKYHLTDCSTIQNMRYGGRGHRYTVTNRTDGWFDCKVGSGWGPKSSRTLRMRLCLNCLKHLEPETYWRMSKQERLETSRNYDLKAHFHTYQNVGHTPPVPPPTPPRPPSANPQPPTVRPRGQQGFGFPPSAPAPAPSPPPAPASKPPPTRPSLIGLPDWVPRDTDEQFQAALLHIDRHGSITEPELAQMLGGARRVRRFARALRHLTDAAPYGIERSSRSGLSIFRRQRR